MLLIIKREACKNPWISMSLMRLSVLFKSYDVAGFSWYGAREWRSNTASLLFKWGRGAHRSSIQLLWKPGSSRRPSYYCVCFGIQTSNYPALTPLRLGRGRLLVLCVLLGHHHGWWLLSNTGGNPAFWLHVLWHCSERETCDNQEKANHSCAFAGRLEAWP